MQIRSVAFLLPLLLVLAAPARGEYVRGFEFDVDGVRPSAESGVEYVTDFDAETDVVTVAGGQMTFDTIGRTQALYQIEVPALDLGGDFLLECRLRIDAIEGSSHGGFAVFASDGTTEYSLLFRPDGVAVNVVKAGFGTGGFFTVDHSVFRTYELVAAGGAGEAELRIDGVPQGTTSAPPSPLIGSFVGWFFGDVVNTVSNADTEVQFLRLTVPEPGASGTGLAAIAALLARRLSLRAARSRSGRSAPTRRRKGA